MPATYPTEDVPFSTATCMSAFLVLRGPGEGALTAGADLLAELHEDLRFAADAVRGAASTLVAVHEGAAAEAAHRHLRSVEAAVAEGAVEAQRAVRVVLDQAEHVRAVRAQVAALAEPPAPAAGDQAATAAYEAQLAESSRLADEAGERYRGNANASFDAQPPFAVPPASAADASTGPGGPGAGMVGGAFGPSGGAGVPGTTGGFTPAGAGPGGPAPHVPPGGLGAPAPSPVPGGGAAPLPGGVAVPPVGVPPVGVPPVGVPGGAPRPAPGPGSILPGRVPAAGGSSGRPGVVTPRGGGPVGPDRPPGWSWPGRPGAYRGGEVGDRGAWASGGAAGEAGGRAAGPRAGAPAAAPVPHGGVGATPGPAGTAPRGPAGQVPLMPFGAATHGDVEHERPPWLLEDDPEAVWFAGLPDHVDPVVGAAPGPDQG